MKKTKTAQDKFKILDQKVQDLMSKFSKPGWGWTKLGLSKKTEIKEMTREEALTKIDECYRSSYVESQMGIENIACGIQEILVSHQDIVGLLEMIQDKEKDGTVNLNDYRELMSEITSLPVLGVDDKIMEKLSPGAVEKTKEHFKEIVGSYKKQQDELVRILGTMFAVAVTLRDRALSNYCSYHTVLNPIRTLVTSASAASAMETDSHVLPDILTTALEASTEVVINVLQNQDESTISNSEMTNSLMQAQEKLKSAFAKFNKKGEKKAENVEVRIDQELLLSRLSDEIN
ncbi:MAG: hypothetical protein KGJ58_00920 [Patescibacteria group bacterium]|nr:hypothetical protein [Patescibacteria group bacterium]MDE2218003.1 hypothetical protein [Patescibacteria group bacterium]